jgi:hypothetical protein
MTVPTDVHEPESCDQGRSSNVMIWVRNPIERLGLLGPRAARATT